MRNRISACFLMLGVLAACSGQLQEVGTRDAGATDGVGLEASQEDILFVGSADTSAELRPNVPDSWTKETYFDSATELAGPQCSPGEGCFLDPCDENSDCLSGWCIDHLGDGVCTQVCEEECPLGFTCTQVAEGGPDLNYVCVSNHTSLCRPCATNADCKSAQGVEDLCIRYEEEGFFCGSFCDGAAEDLGCPPGFSCKEAQTVDGIAVSQCLADSGKCPCTDKSIALALWTPCSKSNDWGTCTAKRICMEEGLSPCDAAVPAEDECNGVDDDCDGETDEETCDDDNACTDDLCLGADGCGNLPNNDTCEDGDSCTFGDKCVGGECVPGVNPLFEMCNGLDDDCDGDTDEGFPLGETCSEGQGACLAEGTTECAAEGFGTECSALPGEPIVELCNGLDDDCDGIIDEDFVLGSPCTVGVGACESEGAVVCADDGSSLCDAEETLPEEEKCDGLDNDCDGEVDDLDSDACDLTNAWGSCPGTLFCLAGGASICLGAYPTSEACNSVDDDCDGSIDETYDVGVPCKAGAGICQVDGLQACTEDGTGTKCAGEALPPEEESCNGLDDDCDGEVDEPSAAGCEVYLADLDEDGFGKDGDSQCLCGAAFPYTAAEGGDCSDKDASVTPDALESCNGKDDNCDGAIDEPGALGCALFYVDGDKDGYGKEGDWSCLCAPDGDYILIIGGDCNDDDPAVRPGTVELCNGKDDNCDGELDEGYVTGIPCAVGIGACAAEGSVVCSQDGKEVACNVAAGQPTEEKCNGVDDNCNGPIDEGFPGVGVACEAGIGECKAQGMLVCTADGLDLECNALPEIPGNELCGGGDEDCDGEVDEAYAGGCTPFFMDSDSDGHGIADDQKCLCLPVYPYTAAMVGDCDDNNGQAHPGGQEKCGNGDEDCNGVVDDEGAQGCNAYYPDNDADGYGPDEDSKCLCAAAPPYSVTSGGDCDDVQATVNPGAKEVCGAGDENCDGAVDENGAEGCVIAYQDEDGDGHGTQSKVCSCKIGEGYVGFIFDDCDDQDPQAFAGAAEFCNGVDDDCDGEVDDGYDLQGDPAHCGECNQPCPAVGPLGLEHTCVGGECVVKACPEGKFDVDLDPNNGCEVEGNILYVDDSNNTGIEDGTLAHPFKTVNLALFLAEPQTVVHVFNGTYNEKVVVETQHVTIRGESRAGVVISQQDPLFPTVETIADSFTLRNLTVHGKHFGIKISGARLCILRDVDVTGSGEAAPEGVDSSGVLLADAQSNSIIGLGVSGFRGGTAAWGIGMRFENSIHNFLSNNAFSNIHGPDNADPYAGAVALWVSEDSWDNEVTLTNTAGGSPIVYLFRQHGATVNGLDLQTPLAPTNLGKIVAVESEGIVIKDNQVASYRGFSPQVAAKNGAPGYGIRVLSCPSVEVQGNTVSSIWGGNGADQIQDIYGSTAGAGATAYGILVENSPSALITGNDVSSLTGGGGGDTASHFGKGGGGGTARGISLTGVALGQVTGNSIHGLVGGKGGDRNGQHGYGGGGGSLWGIDISGSAGATIEDNDVSSLAGGAAGKPGNYSNNNKPGGSCRAYQFTNSSGLTIGGNSASELNTGTGPYGALNIGFALSNAAEANLQANEVTGLTATQPGSSSAYGFQLSGSGGCTLKENVASDFTAGPSTSLYFLFVDSASENAQVEMNNLAGGDPVVFLHGADGTVVSGLKLTSNLLSSNYGKVVVLASSDVVLEDLEVRGYPSSGSSAGIRITNCLNCEVNRVIVDSISGSNAAGLLVDGSANLSISNLTMRGVGDPSGDSAKGLHLTASSTATVNSAIFAGVYGHCVYNEALGAALSLRYSALFGCTQSTVYANNAETYKLLYLDPQFVDEAGGDLHLKGTSPCVDAGDPEAQYCAEQSPNGCRIDMGGYGGAVESTPKPAAQHCPCN